MLGDRRRAFGSYGGGAVRNRLWMSGVVLALVAASCGAQQSPGSDGGGSAAGGGGGGDCGDVVINEQSWVGSTANVYVAKNLLENELGCTVSITKIAEIPVFEAMADGKVDVILEDWQHTTEYTKYVDELGHGEARRLAGRHRPHRLVRAQVPRRGRIPPSPRGRVWRRTRRCSRRAESGDKGQFLSGDPSYVTNDESSDQTHSVSTSRSSTQAARRPRLLRSSRPMLRRSRFSSIGTNRSG